MIPAPVGSAARVGRLTPSATSVPITIVQAVNTAFAVYNKSTGALLSSTTFNSLWSGAGTGTPCDNSNYGDPVVVYDPWATAGLCWDFAFTLSGGNPVAPCYECIAVSKTSDPVSGGWYLYAINQTRVPGANHRLVERLPQIRHLDRHPLPDGQHVQDLKPEFLGVGSGPTTVSTLRRGTQLRPWWRAAPPSQTSPRCRST